MSEPVLSVQGLVTEFATDQGLIRAVDGVSWDLFPGETLAIVGESGSGKSVTALSLLGLLPAPQARIPAGRVLFQGRDLLQASKAELRHIRGADIAMVFQDPMTSLNPVFSVGSQIVEALRTHDRRMSLGQARKRSIELLELVGVPNAEQRFRQYPHEYSGGMRQRAMIAMAIANQPKVLIADEPTTALDVTIQAQVLEVLQNAQRETGAATVLITHDLGVVAEMADRVLVMYAGRVVETAHVRTTFHTPRHPYTFGLITSLPKLDDDLPRLSAIPGEPPSLLTPSAGCAFHPRCQLSQGREPCLNETPPLYELWDNHRAACHFHDEMATETRKVAEAGDAGVNGVRTESI
jgi:oligopeptide/dipeptide ABC transporter ATP-binding protein